MNTATVKTVIFSHLEDIKFENGQPDRYNNVTARANFIKWLLIKFKDLTQEIRPEDEYALFHKLHPELTK